MYQAANEPPPEVGLLNIVIDGRGNPVCVVETISAEVKRFTDVDAVFAYDYGEWDRTLEHWRMRRWTFNVERCQALGKAPTPEMLLVGERFKVVYP